MIPRKQQTLMEKCTAQPLGKQQRITYTAPALGLALTIIQPLQQVLVINMPKAHRPALPPCLEWESLTQISFGINFYSAQSLNFLSAI